MELMDWRNLNVAGVQPTQACDVAELLNPGASRIYLDFLFARQTGIVNLRFIPEKGTSAEGGRINNIFLALEPGWIDSAIEHITRASAQHYASYVLPATLKDRSGKEEALDQFTTIPLDIDCGDTSKKLKWLVANIR